MLKDKTVTVLGSTGSVGTQALDVIRESGYRVKVLSGHRNIILLAEQVREFSPEAVVCADEHCAAELSELTDNKTEILCGSDSLCDLLKENPADVTVHAIAGLAGIESALAASNTATRLAMANKEAIICAGDIIFRNLKNNGGSLIPVDSEHSAIFQCLAENKDKNSEGVISSDNVKRILLTASGGPFFGKNRIELEKITPEMALDHPTWKMGPKITVDSATLMNKGFEIIEAVRLFGVLSEQVEVLIHRQSIIHSMVEYIDNTVIAQLGSPDMRSAVRYALSYPQRTNVPNDGLDFAAVSSLTFDKPDPSAFPLLDAGRTAYKMGGSALCSLIAADEEAVQAFLERKIGFCDISEVVFDVLGKVGVYEVTEETLCAAEKEARQLSRQIIMNM